MKSKICIIGNDAFVGEVDKDNTVNVNAVGVMWYAFVESFCLVDFHEQLHILMPELSEDEVHYAEMKMAELYLGELLTNFDKEVEQK